MFRVLICAGGTGGGIYPAMTAAAELQKEDAQILWVGTHGEMEESLVPRAGFTLETISAGPIISVPIHKMLANAARLGLGFFKAAAIIRRFRPQVMFMTGGYVAAPVALAARITGVPICIYLPDIEPGASVKFALRFAEKIAATTAGSEAFIQAAKLIVTGYPVRAELRAAARLTQADALAQFNLGVGRQTLFVFGGSRGAWNINQALMAILPEVLEEFQVIHISGTLTWDKVKTYAENLPPEKREFYRPHAYLHERMGAAYRAADLVVARAGASMIGESPAFGVPAILVPLAWAWRYQKVNADFMTRQGAAMQLTDEELGEKLLPVVRNLFRNKSKLAKMGQAAAKMDRPDAAQKLAEMIRQVGKQMLQATAVGADS